jgi:hypothetical protein
MISREGLAVIGVVGFVEGVESKTAFCKAGFLCVLKGDSGIQAVNIKSEAKALAPIVASLFLPFLIGCDDLHKLGDHIAQHSLRERAYLAVNYLTT